MFMNIYIGVLGTAYEDMKNNANELFTKYRLNVAMTLLYRREFRERCAAWATCCCKSCWSDKNKHAEDNWWIRLPVEELSESVETDTMGAATSSELHQMKEEI